MSVNDEENLFTNKTVGGVVFQNMRSFKANRDKLYGALDDMENLPEIICLQEMWAPENFTLTLPEYHKAITKLRKKNKGGGVGIFYIKNVAQFL